MVTQNSCDYQPTQYNVLTGGASGTLNNVSPSSTSGVPLISQGSSSQPTFGTAVVAGGGTGVTSTTAYAVLCGGTTSTAALQSIAGVGTSGQVLTSNGAGALPTFQNAAGGSGSMVLLKTQTASSSASLSFTSTYITSTYSHYVIVINAIIPATNANQLFMDMSTDNGSTYLGSNYLSGLNDSSYASASWNNGNSSTSCPLSRSGIITNTVGISGRIDIFGLATSAASGPSYTGQMFGNTVQALVFGFNSGSPNVNNIKFSFSSGNISSGTISLYGITQ